MTRSCLERPGIPAAPPHVRAAVKRMLASGCLAVSGCAASPAQAIAGSFFPSWIICVVAGIVVTAVARQLLVLASLEGHLLLPPLTYGAMALGVCLLCWLFWFGQ